MGLIILPFVMIGAAVMIGIALFGVLLRVAVRLLLLPLLIVKWIVLGIVMLIVAPILLIVGAVVFLSAGLAVAVPLLPILAVGAILWFLFVKGSRRQAVI